MATKTENCGHVTKAEIPLGTIFIHRLSKIYLSAKVLN